MPTAAKLFAAISFALIAFFASEVFKPLLPEGTQTGLLSPLNTVIGLLSGWLVMGRLPGKGYATAAESGIRTSATALFFCLVLWSLYIMLVQSTRLRYDGPMEAITAMFELVGENGALLFSDAQGPMVLLIGGILGGFLTEWASRRFN